MQLKLNFIDNIRNAQKIYIHARAVPAAVNIGLSMLCGLALLLFYLSVSTPDVHAQDARERHWRHFRQEDGLISNDIWSVLVQDDVVWLGTDLGLARYDGEWRNFYNLDSVETGDELQSGLKRGYVVALADSRQPGALWAGSSEGFVSRWDGHAWKATLQVPANIHELRETDGVLYIGSSIGLWQLDLANEDLELIVALGETPVRAIQPSEDGLWVGTEDGLWQYQDGGWQAIALPDILSGQQINALWLDSNDVLWLGTPDGVVWYELETKEWSNIILPLADQHNAVTSVLTLVGDGEGAVWAGADGGGARKFIDYGFVTTDVSRASGGGLTTPLIGDIAIDDDGSVWFATPVGLFQYRARIWFSDYQSRSGMEASINAVNDLLVDRNGDVWIATAGSGIRRKLATKFGYQEDLFTTENSDLPTDAIFTLAEDGAGGIWAGSYVGPVRYIDGAWSAPFDILELPSTVTTVIMADDDIVWIGTEAGLAHYNLTSGEVTDEPTLAGMSIEALAKDGLGQLWVGTNTNGIFLLRNNGRWQHFINDATDAHSFPDVGVLATGLTPDLGTRGGMWAIAPAAGLLRWDGQQWREGDPGHSLPDSLLYRIYTDRIDGTLWVGSETGVSHFDGLTWGVFSIDDGLQSTATYAIGQEADGTYWFGGPEGLTRYWPEQTPPWVRVAPVTGFAATEGGLEAFLDSNVEIELQYGDLQAPNQRIDLFYRVDADSAWQELDSDRLTFPLSALGAQSLEFVARDPAFNYSQPVIQSFTVVNPPRITTLPLLGEVEQSIFWTLLLLAGTALLGFSYVSIEIIQNRRRINDAVNRGYNPYVSGDPVRTEEMFFGRHQTVQRIVDTLHNNSIMIHGERRIGKTTLLYQLASVLREVDDLEYWFIPVYVDLEGTHQEEFFHFLIEEITHGLVGLPWYEAGVRPMVDQLHFNDMDAAAYRDRDFSYDIRTVINTLQASGDEQYPEKRLRIILLMDEMDVMSGYDHVLQQQLRRIFMRDFSSTLGAVVAGIQISKEWDRVESPWFNLFNEVAVKPFARGDALELLVEPVRDIYSYDAEAAEFILTVSEGRPFRIQQYGLESVNHMLAAGRRRIKLEDVEVAHARIQNSYSIEYADAGLSPRYSETDDHEAASSTNAGQAPVESDEIGGAPFVGGERDRGQWAGA